MHVKRGAAGIMVPCMSAQHCRASPPEIRSIVRTSGSLSGLFGLATPVGADMIPHRDVCAFPVAKQGTEHFRWAKWKLQKVPAHSLKQKQTLFTAQLSFVFLFLRSVVSHFISSNNFTLAMFRLVILLRFPTHGQN